ncbi:NAD(P)H-quinone oxidoreductase [Terrihabitans rhizophilus]|uniref:NAD(P)H-quinone oxidoreductase n=1 Tax=Terrihabitans rhizophilus TaxID=3092662 RepID=A0ABU4RPA5_9HYPH|nr:NAD(P)H-quinone oxidoreductase [Terrihabitans sp. PJ23]MDX6806013.1 NAD(P)H-quinone oxidoreductase [Terrihabitans sp. PJ23]
MMALPTTMTAIEIAEPGGPEVLRTAQRPVPTPASGEVLIKVHAAGINRPDVLQRLGKYEPPPGATDIPGLEVAGTIAALGEGVTEYAVGDRVCALLAGGGYAEYATAPVPQVLPIPEGLSFEEGAVLPETFFTVWSNVFDRGRLKEGETFLVHGGSSGIGMTAIPLAKAFGARVFTTAGSAEKCAACVEAGADRAINYKEEDFVEVIKAETGGRGVDVVLDMVGGDYIPRTISVMATEGRHVSIAFLQSPKIALNFFPVMLKRLTLTASTLRSRPVADKAAIAAQLREKVWPLLAERRIESRIFASFALDQASEAHALMESNRHIGKIVLKVMI